MYTVKCLPATTFTKVHCLAHLLCATVRIFSGIVQALFLSRFCFEDSSSNTPLCDMVSSPGNSVASGLSESSIAPNHAVEAVEKVKDEPAEVSEPPDEKESSYPEGGIEAWLVVLGSFCGM